jgi:hypothetical protein
VGCFHLPNYQITHLPNSVGTPQKAGNLQHFYFVKDRPGDFRPEAQPDYSRFLEANQ